MYMQRLVEYAGQYGTVLFVGHGTLLWYMARMLRSCGWVSSVTPPRTYWGHAVYTPA